MRDTPPTPFQQFVTTEAAGGALLLVCAVAALLVANSPWAPAYHRFWATTVTSGRHVLSLSLHEWINDGLMAVFFLLVGLEIKRETIAGELASARRAALPIAAAIGGMAVPALIYWLVNGRGIASRGWAIPMATDIAFALGALAILAPRAPKGLKVFLASLAIVDDMGAVLVIALFYTGRIVTSALGMAGLVVLALAALNVVGVRRLWPYLALGVVLWYLTLESGVHATIAGVLLALTIPATPFDARDVSEASPLVRLEEALHGFSAFVVMPVFAFSNAGVTLTASSLDRVTLAVVLGLTIGKPLGITVASFAAVRSRLAALPQNVGWTALHGCAWLGGIGFTMSLFIATLAFEGTTLLDPARLGILGASLLAGAVGGIVLRSASSDP